MTKEEAIRILSTRDSYGMVTGYAGGIKEAIDMGLEALKQEPCPYWDYGLNTCRHVNIGALATKPCGDAVSREPRKIDEWDIKGKTAELWIVNGKLQIRHLGTIHNTDLPSVTPIRPKGEWKYDKTIQNWRCSKCTKTPKTLGYVGTAEFMAEHFKYCNHCGAKMVESEE